MHPCGAPWTMQDSGTGYARHYKTATCMTLLARSHAHRYAGASNQLLQLLHAAVCMAVCGSMHACMTLCAPMQGALMSIGGSRSASPATLTKQRLQLTAQLQARPISAPAWRPCTHDNLSRLFQALLSLHLLAIRRRSCRCCCRPALLCHLSCKLSMLCAAVGHALRCC